MLTTSDKKIVGGGMDSDEIICKIMSDVTL